MGRSRMGDRVTAKQLYETLKSTGDENNPLFLLSDPEGNALYWVGAVGARETQEGVACTPLIPFEKIEEEWSL